MDIVPQMLCERCLEDGIERTATEQRYGEALCAECAEQADERQYEVQQAMKHEA